MILLLQFCRLFVHTSHGSVAIINAAVLSYSELVVVCVVVGPLLLLLFVWC